MQIREDNLTGSQITDLVREHLEEMRGITPPQSTHALDLEALRSPEITFWSAWEGDRLLGCGALKELDAKSGEIKSMRTVRVYRRRGVASRILERIVEEAQRRSYDYLNLETGSAVEFAPARSLYLRYGFEYRGPFAEYTDDPNSVYLTKRLTSPVSIE
ncbi:MAG: GNAT family N-acetyltransferase [Cyanobacteriota bacterium]|nr:GNAT family N-acetyltransferase [Cyanobacteriota bacterium]